MGTFPTSFYPFVIGMGFFIPLDLSFSCWFFFLFWKMLMVVNSALGADGLSRFPFIKEQASGGYLALCLIAVWLSRKHLGRVWRKVLCHCQQLRPINSWTMPMNQCVTEPLC